jgi:hypothetical protein
VRGWVVGNNLPDEAKAGRLLLKDYTSGKLVFCERPPAESDAGTTALVRDAEEAATSSDGAKAEKALWCCSDCCKTRSTTFGPSHPVEVGCAPCREQR